MKWYTAAVLVLVAVATTSYVCDACNEAICASLVSKCMLIKCCECNMVDKANCTCCKDCQICLSKLYHECCSCVGLCPPPDPDDSMKKTSTVEELSDPIPELFSVLTEEEDFLKRWTTYSYPVHYDTLYYKPGGVDFSIGTAEAEDHGSSQIHHHPHGVDIDHDMSGMHKNCTVAYMAQCMSLRKCKTSCKSMGAARYRWFHEHGCCQCIGHTCVDYGLNEARCIKCTGEDADNDDDKEFDNSVAEDSSDIDDFEDNNVRNSLVQDIVKDEKAIETV